MVILLYLSRKSSDFNEIWCVNAQLDSENNKLLEQFYNSNLFHTSAVGNVKSWPLHFAPKLISLLLPWHEKFTLSAWA